MSSVEVTTFDTLQWVYEYIKRTGASIEDLDSWLRTQMGIIASGNKTNPRQALEDLRGGLY